MATLTINGRQVTVDDSFLQLSPEQQEATVDEIAVSMGSQPQQDIPQQSDYGQGYFAQGTSGLNEGLANILGAPVDLANAAVGLGLSGVNALFGTDYQPSAEPLGGSAGLKRSMAGMGAIYPETDETGKQMLRRGAQTVGENILPVAGSAARAAQPLTSLAVGGASTLGGGLGAATAEQIAPDNPYAALAGELIGSVAAGVPAGLMAQRSAQRAAEKAVPTIEDLKAQASDLYAQAEARGVVADGDQTQSFSDAINKIARDEELISPAGRINEKYAAAGSDMRTIADYAGQPMNPTQMQVIRDTLADTAFNAEGKEGRIAKKMLNEFDDFVNPLAPELSEARKVSQRYIQAENLNRIKRVAEANAGTYTGSGFENSLRNEYRKLNRAIADERAFGWSPDMQSAINDVASGTKASNAARWVGKFAPTGVVSAAGGTGIGAGIGSMVGSPVLGGIAGTGIMGAGAVGRGIATNMGLRNAEIAELLARSGVPIRAGQQLTPELMRIAQALTAGGVSSLTGQEAQ